MTKWIVTFLLPYLCTLALFAQRAPSRLFPWRKAPIEHLQTPSKLPEINITRQLEKRVAQTYRQAKEVQEQLPADRFMIMGNPVQKIFNTQNLDPKNLYPDQTFLKNSTQTGHYLAARNNRLFLQEIRRMEKVWAQIDENLPRLRQEAAATIQPKNQMSWLAAQIPDQTTQLFIGEAHGYSEIHQSIVQLIYQLQMKHPERKMILFTEFLPENLIWNEHPDISQLPTIFHKYFTIWDQLAQIKVPVIGLELTSVMNSNCAVRYATHQGTLTKQTVWASIEGVRLRNERWKKILAAYRAQFPDTLFIIYTGADHSMYNRPFTLANNPQEHIFVSVLYPDKRRSFQPVSRFTGVFVAKPMRGPLERLVDQLDFQRPVVKWQSPDLPHIAGFDVRIKVPVALQDVED